MTTHPTHELSALYHLARRLENATDIVEDVDSWPVAFVGYYNRWDMYFVLPKIRKGGLTFVCDFTETSPRLGRPFPTMWPLARQSLTLGSHSSSFHREAALTGDVSLFPRISNVVARNLGNSSCQTLLSDTTFSQVRPSKHKRKRKFTFETLLGGLGPPLYSKIDFGTHSS